MIKMKRLGFTFLLSILLAVALSCLTERKAEASEVPLPSQYYFVFNGQQKSAGSEYEMTAADVVVNISAGSQWQPPTTVKFISSDSNIVYTSDPGLGNGFVQLNMGTPGYATITAVITHASGASYSISCVVKVPLEIDYTKTKVETASFNSNRIMVIDPGQKESIYLLNANVTSASGSALQTEVTWKSDDESVASINNATGEVTAVGSGSATITVTTNTVSSQNKPMTKTLMVVVTPQFNLTYGSNSFPSGTQSTKVLQKDVPSDFTLVSKAKFATNLTWEVWDVSTGKKLSIDDTNKMKVTIHDDSGDVAFNNVKAGTYEIYAFANKGFNVNTHIPCAYMKVVVPINIPTNLILTMSVNDSYSIVENFNIPDAKVLNYSYDELSQVIDVDKNTGKITANKAGSIDLTLTYDANYNLYETGSFSATVHITVINGIALSETSATLYTGGSLQLNADISDHLAAVEWSSSNPAVASVDKGLVKALTKGFTTITAQQRINGVLKTATCKIYVEASVSSITLYPATLTLKLKEYATLKATIKPDDLTGVTLHWKSSNEDVVKVTDPFALTATIQGVGGGNAVISAINQDNVVVGYCHVTVQQPVLGITLSETSATVDLSTKRLQLRASVYPDYAPNQAISWSSTDTKIATVDTNGVVTLIKPGTVTIIATSVDSPLITAYCNLTIQIPVGSVSMDESTKLMYVGDSAKLNYTITPNNASINTVTWFSTNTSVVSVDANGKVVAKGVGTAIVMLKTLDGGNIVYCTITVKQKAKGVKLDVSSLKLKAGEYYYIKATLTPADSTDITLTWESSDTKIATVDSNGKVIAKSAGNAIIMVKTETGGVAYCKVSVTQPVSGLILNFTEKTIYKGDTFKLEASVTPSTATKLDVTWKSSNTKVATIKANGEVTGLVGGMTVITCTTVDGGYSESCVVTVKETVTSVKLNYDTYSLGVKKTVVLTATVSNETATNQKVTWKSSNTKIATVNQKGKVTGLKIGYVTITATAKDGSDAEASCEIRVVNPVSSVSLSKTSLSMYVGESKKLTAYIRPKDATYKKAKWTTSDASIAIVDEDGIVIAVKPGSVTITAESQDSGAKKAICYVSIYERVPATGLTLQDKKIVLVPGEQKVVGVALVPANSTDDYTWSTDNAAVASVNRATGKITAKSTGTAYITAMTDSGKTATVEVTVIGLNMTELVLEQYTTYPYPLSVEGATTSVKWSIDNPQVAVVTNGYVSTRAVGKATITAVVNGRRLTCKLKVIGIK